MPAHDQLRRLHMQYILMLYSEEAGWFKLKQTEQEQAMAAIGARRLTGRIRPVRPGA